MATAGVIYVAYGAKARAEAAESIASLRGHNDLPVAVIGERVDGAHHIPFERVDAGGRWAKLNIDLLSPWPQALYLDADTRVAGDLSAGFSALADGWDVVIAPSTKQGPVVMGHANSEDRLATFEALECREILGLQAGVFYFARNERSRDLFAAWREEWARWRNQDQPALLRALERVPVKLWILGWDWNSAGGSIVDHKFGRARG